MNYNFRNANFWIALGTVFLVFIGIGALCISRDTEKRQLRAYVAPVVRSWRGLINGKPLGVEFAMVNYGQTPASHFTKRGTIEIMPFPLPKKYIFIIPQEPIEQVTNVFPKAENPLTGWIQYVRPFTEAEIIEITSDTTHRRAYVFGTLAYSDVFGEAHVTNYCFFMDPLSIKRNDSGVIETFVWAACDQHTDFN